MLKSWADKIIMCGGNKSLKSYVALELEIDITIFCTTKKIKKLHTYITYIVEETYTLHYKWKQIYKLLWLKNKIIFPNTITYKLNIKFHVRWPQYSRLITTIVTIYIYI